MSYHESRYRPVLIGNRRYPRYAIALVVSPWSPTLYFTGAGDESWTEMVAEAMWWADPDTVMSVIGRLSTAEPDDSPG